MTDLSDLIEPARVQVGVACAGRKALFQHVAAVAEATLRLPQDVVVDALADRERLGSTGFGQGVAIPHARIAGLRTPHAIVVRLVQPMVYGSVDDMPVDLAIALLSPPDAGADHLKALARVSRALRDPTLVAKLRGAGSADAVYALLAGVESRDAA